MELSSFIILISIIPTITSSLKCEDTQRKCIPLCCKVTEYYMAELRFCRELPEYGDLKWHLKWGAKNSVEFVEYDNCPVIDDINAFIPLCYSPVYIPGNSRQIDLKKFYDVPCNRAAPNATRLLTGLNYKSFKKLAGRHVVLGLVALCTMLPCLPVMTFYTCRLGIGKNLLLKLVTWYFLTMTAFSLATVLPIIWQDDTIMQLYGSLGDLRCLFCVASCLWLNVIGFQMWLEFKGSNSHRTVRQDKLRLVYFSIYVWGIAAILTYIQQAAAEANVKGANIADWIMFGITCFNTMTFLILSANICQTRCGVANLTNQPHFKRELTRLILRLGLMMGFPRMLAMLVPFFIYYDFSLCMYFCIPEPFVVFVVLVWKPQTCYCYGLICCSSKTPDPTSPGVEVAEMRLEND